MLLDLFHSSHHYSQGFGRTLFPLPQQGDRFGVRGIAGQMEAPQTLDSQDLARRQQSSGPRDHIAALRIREQTPPTGIQQLQMRPADGAGIGLGMETPVEGIIVLTLALRAHLEISHGRPGTVIRDALDDRETGATVGAVSERIAVTPVGGIEQLPPALGAGRDVRRDERIVAFRKPAVANLKSLTALDRNIFHIHPLDARQRRGLETQIGHKAIQGSHRAFHFYIHAPGVVEHPARQGVVMSQTIDKRTKAHPLHDALHEDALSGYTDTRIIQLGALSRFHFSGALPCRPIRASTSQSAQTSSPSPVVQDTSNRRASGFNPLTRSRNAARSKSM